MAYSYGRDITMVDIYIYNYNNYGTIKLWCTDYGL